MQKIVNFPRQNTNRTENGVGTGADADSAAAVLDDDEKYDDNYATGCNTRIEKERKKNILKNTTTLIVWKSIAKK